MWSFVNTSKRALIVTTGRSCSDYALLWAEAGKISNWIFYDGARVYMGLDVKCLVDWADGKAFKQGQKVLGRFN